MNTTKMRLAIYRAKAEKYPKSTGWKTWAKNSFELARPAPNSVRGPDGQIYSESIDQYGDELSMPHGSLDHDGWYTDHWCNETLQAAVCRMRTCKGTYYIPCTRHSDWDGTVHYMRDAEIVPRGSYEHVHEKATRSAWRRADQYAEREAEVAREDAAKVQAEQDIEECRETIGECRDEFHKIHAELLHTVLPETICGVIRDKMVALRSRVRKQIKRIRVLQDDPWSAVEGFR